MNLGKEIRLGRIMDRNTRKTVIIPMDHGLTVGPIKGLENMSDMINKVAEGGANTVLLHKGIVRSGFRGFGKDIGLIVHLSGGDDLGLDKNNKVLVTSVEEAMRLGADAVSIHINVGSKTGSLQIKDGGKISGICEEWGMPLLAMMYPRGPNIKDPHNVDIVKVAARMGVELGADIIKTHYTGSEDTFREVVEGCGRTPVVMAGGPKDETDEAVEKFLHMVRDSIKAGGAGIATGRNVFQHENPTKMVQVLTNIVHHNWTVSKAMEFLNN